MQPTITDLIEYLSRGRGLVAALHVIRTHSKPVEDLMDDVLTAVRFANDGEFPSTVRHCLYRLHAELSKDTATSLIEINRIAAFELWFKMSDDRINETSKTADYVPVVLVDTESGEIVDVRDVL